MRLISFIVVLCLTLVVPGLAQQVGIELGKSPLPINEYYTISVNIQDQPFKEYTPFPSIEGFKKSSKYSATKTMTVGGKTTVIRSIIQNYAALEEGEYELAPFNMTINGQTVHSDGASIEVTPMAVKASPQSPLVIVPELEAPEEAEDGLQEQQEYIEKEDNAFLSLYTSKKEVFVGEGVNVALYFYLATEDQRLLDFYDFANQIAGILKLLKQPNTWEETFEFAEITPEEVSIEGKPYLRFKLYESVLYPINLEPIKFPQLSLKMIKYKVAKTPNLLTEDRKEGYKTFYARERVIKVKELPPHPLRNVVPVGNYMLRESLSKKSVPVNKSFTYLFQVEGEGNLAAIMSPVPAAQTGLEFYPPDVRQDVTRRSGRVVGAKSFSYAVLPREPGDYNMGDALQWIYFNPGTATYDTLQANLAVTITGASNSDAMVLSRDLGSFYNIIENEDSKLVSLHLFDDIKRYTNIILLVLLVVSSFIFLKK
ncbi:BatD family protein [Pontibacter silvestris]|uniref:BatD family protein n=1 Tax=Pontibacter silvestris TaxID=2305183 RepID=A0ABW4WVI1_9BACT|nr:BatD family protein [Pontibacter silvestris]MCC9137261.1 BatD family protein [Pontibacter silvestris]